jgi:hypothetical protein
MQEVLRGLLANRLRPLQQYAPVRGGMQQQQQNTHTIHPKLSLLLQLEYGQCQFRLFQLQVVA